MRKDEVEFHEGHPAVNVKNHRSVYMVPLPIELGGVADADGSNRQQVFTEAGFDHAWIEAHADDFSEQMVAESSWEYLAAQAQEIWGDHVAVYGEGRSGGWAVVQGLAEFDSWDAIELGRWARFHQAAKAIAEDFPRALLVDLYMNVYELADADELGAESLDDYEPQTATDYPRINPRTLSP